MAALPSIEPNHRYTYGEYRQWIGEDRFEIIDGELWLMSPGPNVAHQRIVKALAKELLQYLDGKPCEVLFAPLDVLLPDGDEADDEIDTVVQPDVMVVCDASKIGEKFIKGAPDVVFEVASPSTTARDRTTKFRLYERAGVREYWMVEPTERTITVVVRNDAGGWGEPVRLVATDDPATSPVAASSVLDGFSVPAASLFPKA